jgi:putative transposase
MRKMRYLAPWHGNPAELGGEGTDPEEVAAAYASLAGKPAIYHCVSRIVNRQFVLGREEKEKFVNLMRLYEHFGQIRVLSFCVMSDHVHLLLEIPAPPENEGASWSDDNLLEHISRLYSNEQIAEIRGELEEHRGNKNTDAAEALRQKYLDRMWDLSSFMKVLKQRFTQWFNGTHGRRGTLWEDRFKHVLVEEGHAAQTMAGYIDLNPVRAALVDDPKDYRWSGYGEAVAANEAARQGLCRLMADKLPDPGTGSPPWREVVRLYREILFAGGEPAKGRRGPSRKNAARVLAEGGELSEGDLLRCRVRHLSDGLVFGSEEFVNKVFILSRGYFGPSRKTGARKLRGVRTKLRSMRDLQRDPYSAG